MGFGIGSVVGGPMGIINDLAGSGVNQSKAKNKEARTAAPRDSAQQQIFDDFMTYLYGQPEDKFDAEYYLKNNKDVADKYGIDVNNISEKDKKKAEKHYNKFGKEEGRAAYDASMDQTPYRERLEEDTGYKQGNDQQLLSSILDTNSRIRENNQRTYGNLEDLANSQRGLSKSFVNVSGAGVTGSPIPVQTRGMQNALNYVTGQEGALNQLANATANLNLQGAQAVNQYQNAYTPNRAANEYMNYIQSLSDKQDALRYGIPTETTTGTYQPSFLETLGSLMSAAGGAAKIASA